MEKKFYRKPSISKKRGFSLAELLFSLLILGILSAFSIPKILVAMNNAQKFAIMKETTSALSTMTYQGMTSSEVSSIPTAITYVKNHMNYIKWCDDITVDGCRTVPTSHVDHNNLPGFLMANGAIVYLSFYTTGSFLHTDFIIDWNNDDLPNATYIDGDVLALKANFTHTPYPLQSYWCTSTSIIRPGELKFACELSHQDIFERVFGLK